MADPVGEFWRWFEANAETIRSAYLSGDTGLLTSLLSARVAALATGTNWEIGPYAPPGETLVLSPDSREELPAVKAAVARAPKIDGWTFIACKPPKDISSLAFEIAGISTNADTWVYRMTSYQDGEFVDLELFYESSVAPPVGHESLMCELVVEALVGEELRLERMGYLTPSCVPDVASVTSATAMKYLRPHLLQVLKPLP